MEINSVGSSENLMNKYNLAKTKDDGEFAARLEKATQNVKDDKQKAKLKDACQQMEAVFLNMMWSRMRATVPKSSLFGEDTNEEDIIHSMLDSEMTKNMAKAGGIGLADMLYRQLSVSDTANKNQAPK